MAKIDVKGTSITVYSEDDKDFISLTDMLRAKAVRYGGIYAHNTHFIHQGLAQAEPLQRLNQTAIQQMKLLLADAGARRLEGKQP